MNTLPEHRRVVNGRTFDRPWCAADYDPITAYKRVGWLRRIINLFF